MNKYMEIAIAAARKGMSSNMGGPFGAVIVRDNEVIAGANLFRKFCTCGIEVRENVYFCFVIFVINIS